MGSCYYQWNNKDIVSDVEIAVFVSCATQCENAKQKESYINLMTYLVAFLKQILSILCYATIVPTFDAV